MSKFLSTRFRNFMYQLVLAASDSICRGFSKIHDLFKIQEVVPMYFLLVGG